jgi:Zn finger protein HypA/HybF involved in hydrogenase expression
MGFFLGGGVSQGSRRPPRYPPGKLCCQHCRHIFNRTKNKQGDVIMKCPKCKRNHGNEQAR